MKMEGVKMRLSRGSASASQSFLPRGSEEGTSGKHIIFAPRRIHAPDDMRIPHFTFFVTLPVLHLPQYFPLAPPTGAGPSQPSVWHFLKFAASD